ncbi:hypothetical protein [Rhizobium sp. 768_B6_N1_8]|uniref:hypothetical protein n=1 Tax=unclassified Rhizobium TaxID=2613769 RepID=UPI003F219D57
MDARLAFRETTSGTVVGSASHHGRLLAHHAKLAALHTQKLTIQSLSIANSSWQSILSLFRGKRDREKLPAR